MNEFILEGRARFVAFTTDAREMAIIYWGAKRMQPSIAGPLCEVRRMARDRRVIAVASAVTGLSLPCSGALRGSLVTFSSVRNCSLVRYRIVLASPDDGHVTRSSGLAKTILQGTVQGGRRRGRQRTRWEDNIKEWTGLEWNIILRKAENREEWRKLVVKSTVVPQRSA